MKLAEILMVFKSPGENPAKREFRERGESLVMERISCKGRGKDA